MEKTLRFAGEEDCRAAYELMCVLEEKKLSYEDFERIYHEQLNDGRHRMLLCVTDGTVCGLLNMRMENQLHHADKVAEILEFVVDDSFRGQGIGAFMLDEAVKIAGENGCAVIEASSNKRRLRAHKFYRANGMDDTHLGFEKMLK